MNSDTQIPPRDPDIPNMRDFVLDMFSYVETQMNLFIANAYFHRKDRIAFIEDILMSGQNGFGLRLELYISNIKRLSLMEAKDAQALEESLRKLAKTRNYFAHTHFFVETEQMEDGTYTHLAPYSLTKRDNARRHYSLFQEELERSNPLSQVVMQWTQSINNAG